MSEEDWRYLREQLRGEPPPALSALAGEHLRHLADAVGAARRRQAEALEAAGEQAFAYVPRMLRGPIRRMLG
jgi:hypothetical protein